MKRSKFQFQGRQLRAKLLLLGGFCHIKKGSLIINDLIRADKIYVIYMRVTS